MSEHDGKHPQLGDPNDRLATPVQTHIPVRPGTIATTIPKPASIRLFLYTLTKVCSMCLIVILCLYFMYKRIFLGLGKSIMENQVDALGGGTGIRL